MLRKSLKAFIFNQEKPITLGFAIIYLLFGFIAKNRWMLVKYSIENNLHLNNFSIDSFPFLETKYILMAFKL